MSQEKDMRSGINNTNSLSTAWSKAKSGAIPIAKKIRNTINEKLPSDPKIKMIVIFGGIGALALVITLAIFVFSASRINVLDYINVEITESSVLDGNIRASVHLDQNALFTRITGVNSRDIYEAMGIQTNRESYLSKLGFHLYDYADIVVSVNNKEVETEDLKYLSTSDEIKVTLKWKTDKESKKALKEFERENKVRFKTSTDSYSVSLKEVAKKQMVDVRKPVEVNIFDELEKLGALVTYGFKDERLWFKLDDTMPVEFEIGGYVFKTERKKSGYFMYPISIYKDDALVGEIGFKNSNTDFVHTGDTITISINEDWYSNSLYDDQEKHQLDGTDILFVPPTKKYTLEKATPLTAEQAKKNIKLIEERFQSLDSRKAIIDRIDFYTTKESSPRFDTDYNSVCIFYHMEGQEYHSYYIMGGAFIQGNAFHYSDASSPFTAKLDLNELISEVNGYHRNYKHTKIK